MLNTKRYPFSTTDGRHIPLDVIKPYGLIRQSISFAASSAELAIPAEVEVISFYATVDCVVTFGNDSEIPVDGQVDLTDLVFIPANTMMVVAAVADTFSVIGVTEDGFLWAQLLDSWQGLSLEVQNSRR